MLQNHLQQFTTRVFGFLCSEKVYNLDDISQWWQWVNGADWKHPEGPISSVEGKENYPVVQFVLRCFGIL